jgi:glycerophosphoryl diester phosphodiesterase
MPSAAPENTLAGFRAAADAGAAWIETDLRVIADGGIALCHDSTLDRTTNRVGPVADLRREDLGAIDAGGWFGPEFAGEPLPSLSQLIDLLNERGLNAHLELKLGGGGRLEARRLVESLAAELERLAPGRSVVLSSFNHLALAHAKRELPQLEAACCWDTSAMPEDWRSVAEFVGAAYIHLDQLGLTPQLIGECLSAGFVVNAWGEPADPRMRANQLFNWGVSGIFTDHLPELL